MAKRNKMLRKVLVTMCSAVLLVGATVGVTVAFLKDTTGVVNNTFTVGKVGISLDEAVVDEYGETESTERTEEGNEYKLIPGHSYVKDPTVYVDENSEDSWLFVKVVNGIADIEAEGATTIAKQMETNNWIVVDAANGIYRYKEVVSAGDEIPVFSSFTLAEDAEIEKYENAAVTIVACAVQADGLTAEEAANEATFE